MSGPAHRIGADTDVVMQLLWPIEGNGLDTLPGSAEIPFGMALTARICKLVSLNRVKLTWEEQGLRVTIRRSKTDQVSEAAT